MDKHLLSSFHSNVKNWWVSLIVGIVAVVIGIACMLTPIETFATLSYFFIISFL